MECTWHPPAVGFWPFVGLRPWPHSFVSAVCLTFQDSTYLQYFPEGPCKSMVYEYQKLAAQDIRFDLRLADACMDDRTKFCGNVQPVRVQPGEPLDYFF